MRNIQTRRNKKGKVINMELGIKGSVETVVVYDNTAAKMGSGDQEVFATPCMIAVMEDAAQRSVLPYLAEAQATVGTHLDVSHDAATPIGMKVWAESELVEIEGRKLVFRVEAYDECGSIGKGRHERFIIDKEKFMARVKAKQAK